MRLAAGILSALVIFLLVRRYGTAHTVLVRNASGEAMAQVRIGIRFGAAELESLPVGGEARVEFRDGGEGGYRVSHLRGGKDVLVGHCGYSGGAPWRTERLTIVIEKAGVSCRSSRNEP